MLGLGHPVETGCDRREDLESIGDDGDGWSLLLASWWGQDTGGRLYKSKRMVSHGIIDETDGNVVMGSGRRVECIESTAQMRLLIYATLCAGVDDSG